MPNQRFHLTLGKEDIKLKQKLSKSLIFLIQTPRLY